MIVMGAMIGDFGFQLPFDPELGMVVGEATWTFLKRGKMIDYKRMQPQNRTISALIVLNRFPLGQRCLSREWGRKEKELGRKLSIEEFFRFVEVLRTKGMDAGDTIPRVVVHENPYARMPLTREIFVGPFDERFGPEGDHMMRVFAGTEIEKLEAEENALK